MQEKRFFEYTFAGRIFAYDCWGWLEMICRSKEFKHPVFGVDLSLEDNMTIYNACITHNEEIEYTTFEQKELLRQCCNTNITKKIRKNIDNDVIGLEICPVSPLFKFQVIDKSSNLQDKKKLKNQSKNIKCTAILTYRLLDIDNAVVSQKTLYL